MTRFAWTALLATVIGCVAACGGGSDGGYVRPIDGDTFSRPATPMEPESEPQPDLTLQVTVNGAAATPSVEGKLSVASGDVVTVTPSQSVNWLTASTPEGAIALLDPEVNADRWSAKIVNSMPDPVSFFIGATATADAAQSKSVTLSVAPVGSSG